MVTEEAALEFPTVTVPLVAGPIVIAAEVKEMPAEEEAEMPVEEDTLMTVAEEDKEMPADEDAEMPVAEDKDKLVELPALRETAALELAGVPIEMAEVPVV